MKEDFVSLTNSEAVTEARGHSDPADSAGGAYPACFAQRQTLVKAGGILSLAATTEHPHSSLIEVASRGRKPRGMKLRVETSEPAWRVIEVNRLNWAIVTLLLHARASIMNHQRWRMDFLDHTNAIIDTDTAVSR